MAGISFDAKWTLGVTVTLFGLIIVVVQFQSSSVTSSVLSESKSYVDDKVRRFFSQDEALMALSFRDQRIEQLELDVRKSMETLNKLSTMVVEYRDLVRQFAPKADRASERTATTGVRVRMLMSQMDKLEQAVGNLTESQGEVRERLIPNIARKLDSHAAKAHDLIRFTPNAGLPPEN